MLINSFQIFRRPSYMIYMLKSSLKALIPFVLLTLVVIVGFANGMMQLQKASLAAQPNAPRWIESNNESMAKTLFTTMG